MTPTKSKNMEILKIIQHLDNEKNKHVADKKTTGRAIFLYINRQKIKPFSTRKKRGKRKEYFYILLFGKDHEMDKEKRNAYGRFARKSHISQM